jgi:hypothetical protein
MSTRASFIPMKAQKSTSQAANCVFLGILLEVKAAISEVVSPAEEIALRALNGDREGWAEVSARGSAGELRQELQSGSPSRSAISRFWEDREK